MRYRFSGAVMVVALFFAGAPAFAHHGYATEFDITKCENLKGTLSGVEWENPHAFFHIDVKDSDGKVNTWRLKPSRPIASSGRAPPEKMCLVMLASPLLQGFAPPRLAVPHTRALPSSSSWATASCASSVRTLKI